MSVSVRKVNAIFCRCGAAQYTYDAFPVSRKDGEDIPVLADYFPANLAVHFCRLSVHTTIDPYCDGKIVYCEAIDTWQVYTYHPLHSPQDIEKYVVYFNRREGAVTSRDRECFSTRSDILVFRQALNRAGMSFIPLKLREDRFGLYAVFMYVAISLLFIEIYKKRKQVYKRAFVVSILFFLRSKK